jgi:hypothetical protein
MPLAAEKYLYFIAFVHFLPLCFRWFCLKVPFFFGLASLTDQVSGSIIGCAPRAQ